MRIVGALKNGRRRLGEGHKAAAACALLLVVYATLVFGVLPRHVFFSGDEGEKLVLAASVARSGDLWNVAYEYPGRALDPDGQFFFCRWMHVVGDRIVPGYLSALTFLQAPLYSGLGVDGLYLLSLLSGVAVAWLSYSLARALDLRSAWVMPLLVGLCTPMLFYSLTTWDHAPTVVLTTLTVCLLARQAYGASRWEMVAAGIVAAIAVRSRLEMHLFAVAAVLAYLYVFYRRAGLFASLGMFVAGMALVVVPLGIQQRAVYDGASFFEVYFRGRAAQGAGSGARSLFEAARAFALWRAEIILALTVDGSRVWLERVLLALAFAAAVLMTRIESLGRRLWLVLGVLLVQGAGTLLAVAHMRLPSILGLVPTMPLATFGLAYTSPRPQDAGGPRELALRFVATTTVVYLLLSLALLPSFGSLGWGPRYLAALFPLLAVLAWSVLWRSLSSRSGAAGRLGVLVSFALLVALSLLAQCVGLSLLNEKKQAMLALHGRTSALGTDYLLSEQSWYLQEMADLYFDKTLLWIQSQEEYQAALERLHESGVRRYAWVPSEETEIDPLVETSRFRVRPVDTVLYEVWDVEPALMAP